MVDRYKTPGVYVAETPAPAPRVADVGTAVPAFIGYTARATKSSPDDLAFVPTKISSLVEYEAYFGGPNPERIDIALTTSPAAPSGFAGTLAMADAVPARLLYSALELFFANGGGACYVVSTGGYADPLMLGDATRGLARGLEAVAREDEPTLLVLPDAAKLPFADYALLAQRSLAQCAALRDRFAILDVWGGTLDIDARIDVGGGRVRPLVDANRDAWRTDLRFGAAYYPFLRTKINPFVAADHHNVMVAIDGNPAVGLDTLATTRACAFEAAKEVIRRHFTMLPPSGAVAGVYATVDRTRGPWKAPANVALSSGLEPSVAIDDAQQARLNVDAETGKSINAIRAFPGRGTYVWGARTLAGNDNEWRYVSVRRFVTMVEESVTKATRFAVFEPNDATLWSKLRAMIENYLADKWRAGALMGAAPREAFYVHCGLGTTMSAQDVLDGTVHIELGMAVIRPAEFVGLRLTHAQRAPRA